MGLFSILGTVAGGLLGGLGGSKKSSKQSSDLPGWKKAIAIPAAQRLSEASPTAGILQAPTRSFAPQQVEGRGMLGDYARQQLPQDEAAMRGLYQDANVSTVPAYQNLLKQQSTDLFNQSLNRGSLGGAYGGSDMAKMYAGQLGAATARMAPQMIQAENARRQQAAGLLGQASRMGMAPGTVLSGLGQEQAAQTDYNQMQQYQYDQQMANAQYERDKEIYNLMNTGPGGTQVTSGSAPSVGQRLAGAYEGAQAGSNLAGALSGSGGFLSGLFN